MKRNDDLLRELLLEAEQKEDPFFIVPVDLQDLELIERNYHAKLASDAGLMVQEGKFLFRLTNAGHDYLEAIRDDTNWIAVKKAAKKVGGMTLDMTIQTAFAYLKAEGMKQLGISFD